jgi:hypothetical protein
LGLPGVGMFQQETRGIALCHAQEQFGGAGQACSPTAPVPSETLDLDVQRCSKAEQGPARQGLAKKTYCGGVVAKHGAQSAGGLSHSLVYTQAVQRGGVPGCSGALLLAQGAVAQQLVCMAS